MDTNALFHKINVHYRVCLSVLSKGFVCLGFVLSKVWRIQFVWRIQGLSVHGLFVQGLSVQGLSCKGFICPGFVSPGFVCPGFICPGFICSGIVKVFDLHDRIFKKPFTKLRKYRDSNQIV
jgi:hypothetical protein